MIVLKKQINVTALPKFFAAFKASNHVSGKNHLNLISLVTQGHYHLLKRLPSGKRKKCEERNEVIVSDNELDISNARLSEEIIDLKSELTKHKEEARNEWNIKKWTRTLL